MIAVDPPSLPEAAVRAIALYGPVALVVTLARAVRPDRRHVAGAVLATAWNLASLLAVNVVAVRAGWWQFATDGPSVAGVPVDLWIGWALLWGATPVLALAGLRRPAAPAAGIAVAVVTLVAADLVLMPLGEPVVDLAPSWLVGEIVAVAACLGPGLLLGRWTSLDERLVARVVLQVGAFTALVFYAGPSILFAATGDGDGWATLLGRPRWQLVGTALLVSPVVGMGLQAVAEFAASGGTPLPLDPPRALVTTGPYAYVANPMQLTAVIMFAAWGAVLGSWLVVGAAAVTAVFLAGPATWSEGSDLGHRFGDEWSRYRRRTRMWCPTWRPAVVDPGTVHVAESCEPCRPVGRFLRRRPAVGLDVQPAGHCPQPLRRITYERAGRQDLGIAAIGRSLEHVNLAWAAASWTARLPAVQPFLQLLTDATPGHPPAARSRRAPAIREGPTGPVLAAVRVLPVPHGHDRHRPGPVVDAVEDSVCAPASRMYAFVGL